MLGTMPIGVGTWLVEGLRVAPGLGPACWAQRLWRGLREAPALMEAVARSGVATPAGDHRDGFQGDRRQKGVSSVCRVGSMRPEWDGA